MTEAIHSSPRRLTPHQFQDLFDALPTPYVVLTRDMIIVEANAAFLASTGRERADLLSTSLFVAFPPAPDSEVVDGVSVIEASLRRVRDTGVAETMPIQRYPIADDTGMLSERFWLLVGAPLVDEQGRVELLVQRVEDVTDFIRERDPAREGQIEADLYSRSQELAEALHARDTAARRVASVAEVALALTSAATVEDLEQIVVGRGLTVLGADGGAVISGGKAGGWRITVNAALGEHVQGIYGDVDYDSPLPACAAARSGIRVLLPTRESGLEFHPVMAQVYADTERLGWAFLPLQIQDQHLGSLAVSWTEEHRFLPDELDLLDGFAAQCAQALLRIRTSEAQQAATAQVRQLSGALQQALLTPPPEPDHLHLVVRYLPAADQAQVGGDWYDAFIQPDGATMLVIGDVVGHDEVAAAKMGQLRGLLRALAYAADESNRRDTPASILTRVEHAAKGLAVDTLATVVLARIERIPHERPTGDRRLRWSNAGHPPPLLVYRDGTSRFLTADPDMLLGVDPDAVRHDHSADLPDGSTLLLYTDGLIERRQSSIDAGLADLQEAVRGLETTDLTELCDRVLERLAPHTGEDDIALVAVRAYDEDQPRPAEAGPNRLPEPID